MQIYERIFNRLDELKVSQSELSRKTGISTSTISDWKKKKINPQADKLVAICKALEMSLVDLLCNEEDKDELSVDYINNDKHIIECIKYSDEYTKRKIITYIEEMQKQRLMRQQGFQNL